MDIIDTIDNLDSLWENHNYDEETLEMLYKRRQIHFEENGQVFSIEETIDYIKSYTRL